MVRASAVAERAGVRSASIISSAFLAQAHAIAKAQGLASMAIAEYPGVPMTHSREELRQKVKEMLLGNIIEGLTTPQEAVEEVAEPKPRDIVFQGTLDEVHDFFRQNLWTDGLPIIPPTIGRVEQFLRFADRSPEEVIGVLLPENRQATVWNVAVNGVMAGCRPEYMPVLLAVVEAISEPRFRIEDAGSTPGWEPIIILNGPIIKELDFNYGAGVLRVGRQANTSVGRFLRLYMRNVAGLRISPGTTDKGAIASTFNVVLAENEDAVAELGWQPFSVDQGFQKGDNVVTVQSVVGISPPIYSGGSTAVEHMEVIADMIGERVLARWTYHAVNNRGEIHHLFVMSPSIAGVIARSGWTKDDFRQYLYEHCKIRADICERIAWAAGMNTFNLCESVKQGFVSAEYCQSDDPKRMVPVFPKAEDIEIVLSGDPGRNQTRGYGENSRQGAPTSKKIVLPEKWERLLPEARIKRR